jgi:hypothetical protein
MSLSNLTPSGWVCLFITITVLIDIIQDVFIEPDNRVPFLRKQFTKQGFDYWNPLVVSVLVTYSLWLMTL